MRKCAKNLWKSCAIDQIFAIKFSNCAKLRILPIKANLAKFPAIAKSQNLGETKLCLFYNTDAKVIIISYYFAANYIIKSEINVIIIIK